MRFCWLNPNYKEQGYIFTGRTAGQRTELWSPAEPTRHLGSSVYSLCDFGRVLNLTVPVYKLSETE